MPTILAFGRLRQEDLEFELILGYIVKNSGGKLKILFSFL